MIVKMKKLTLLCTKAEQEDALHNLRELKSVHIEHIESPAGETVEQAKQSFQRVQTAHQALAHHESATQATTPHDDVVDAVWACLEKKSALEDELQRLESEIERIQPFGDMNPASLQALIIKGLFVQLCQSSLKEESDWPQEVTQIETSRDKASIYSILISRTPIETTATSFALPELSLAELEKQQIDLNQRLAENSAALETLSQHCAVTEQICSEAKDELVYQEVRQGMAASEELVYLNGYIPAEQESTLDEVAKEHGWGYVLDDVGPDDTPPTLLRNPKWVDPIKAVLSVIGVVPGYKELDVSAIFLLFLSIFFALLIGDAGYGLLFIALTLIAQQKNKQAPAYVYNLLYIMSGCTVVWGALTGTYFGMNFSALPAPLQNLSNDWLRGNGDDAMAMNNVMFFCFVLGTLHLVIGHVWNLIRKINSWSALADLGWICSTLTMFFAVRMMVLAKAFPTEMLYVLAVGLLLIVVSLVMEKAYFGLVTLALDVISNFVDIISYVRLYAVGAASFAIANAFNTMAIEALGSSGIIVGGLIAALALFGGHALNILLCAMGILVHGIRLNTLEFSSHAGVQWGGLHYNPFKRTNEKF